MSTSTPPAGGQMPPAEGDKGQMLPTSGQMPTTPHTPSEGADPNTAAEIQRLREENKQRRLSEEATKAELKKLQDAQLSEAERAQKRLAELEADQANHQRELQELRVSRTVERLAVKLSIVDPEAATSLMDWSQLEFDKDTGQPTNAESVLKALIKAKPYLAGTPAGNPAIVSPTNPGSTPGAPFFSRAQLENLDFYSKNKEAIHQALKEGRYEK